MRRLPGWPARLAGYVAARASVPFAWGSQDCVTFAVGAIEAITGKVLPLPTWRSASEALRELAARGGIAGAVDSAGMRPLLAPALARRGDLLLIPQLRSDAALVVCLGHVWAGPAREGLEFGPVRAAARGWKVG
jgi:hypothetical protein